MQFLVKIRFCEKEYVLDNEFNNIDDMEMNNMKISSFNERIHSELGAMLHREFEADVTG
jgi:hypothetical protein